MGKATKLLSIAVTEESMLQWSEVVKLAEQGHSVCYLNQVHEDVVMGPNCWMMDGELRKYLPMAVKAGRERKYGKKGVTHDVLQDQITKPEAGGEGGEVAEGAVGDDGDGVGKT